MIKKVLFFLFSLTLLASFFVNNPTPAAAFDGCSVVGPHSATRTLADGSPAPADDTDKFIQLKIDSANQLGQDPVYVRLKPVISGVDRFDSTITDRDGRAIRFTPSADGIITIPKLNSTAQTDYDRPPFKAGETYTLTVTLPDDGFPTEWCQATFKVGGADTDPGSDNYCEVSYTTDQNDYTKPNTHVGIKVKFAPGANNTNDADTHRVIIKSKYDEKKFVANTLELKNGTWFVPIEPAAATYSMTVREFAKDSLVQLTDEDGKRCETEWPFKIDTEANGGGYECSRDTTGCEYTNIKPNQSLSQPCDSEISSDWSKEKGCLRIKTALGTIGTEAPEFVRWVLGFVLGISGGIVLIIIIITGYRLMTSQGDPEKVKNAKDALTAAIVGLLFIIFSLVILQFITADILQLPGFGG